MCHVLTLVRDHSLPFSQVSSSKQHRCRFCSAVQEVEGNFSQSWSVEGHLGNGLLAVSIPKTESRTISQANLVGQVVLVQKPRSAIDTCHRLSCTCVQNDLGGANGLELATVLS